jgi:SAM-dependent methyltransferase
MPLPTATEHHAGPPARPTWRQRLRRLTRPAWLGTLRRTRPLSSCWGEDRGTPVDRYYIERFMQEHRADIRGRVLEVKESEYTRRFGREVERADVLDIDDRNPQATIVADLTAADAVPSETFDCFVLTQTLQFIYDSRGAVRHAWRVLRPGGVLLATVPATSRVINSVPGQRDYWRFTESSCTELFGERFGPARVSVRGRGSVLTCIAFLSGLAREELSRDELEADDPDFPVLITVRAVKAGSATSG